MSITCHSSRTSTHTRPYLPSLPLSFPRFSHFEEQTGRGAVLGGGASKISDGGVQNVINSSTKRLCRDFEWMTVCSHVILELYVTVGVCVAQTVTAHAADKGACSRRKFKNRTQNLTKHHRFQSTNSNCYCRGWLMSVTCHSSRTNTHTRPNLPSLPLSFPRLPHFEEQTGRWAVLGGGADFVNTKLHCMGLMMQT